MKDPSLALCDQEGQGCKTIAVILESEFDKALLFQTVQNWQNARNA